MLRNVIIQTFQLFYGHIGMCLQREVLSGLLFHSKIVSTLPVCSS